MSQYRKNAGAYQLIDNFSNHEEVKNLFEQLDRQLESTPLFQNQWGCLYAFIQTAYTSPPELLFIDDPEFIEKFYQKHAITNAYKKNDLYEKTLKTRLMSAIFKLDEAYLSPKIYQQDTKNFFIKINQDKCILIRERNFKKSEEHEDFLSIEISSSSNTNIRLLPPSKIYTINYSLFSYIHLLLNKEDFIRNAKSQGSLREKSQHNLNNYEDNFDKELNDFIYETCQGKPDSLDFNYVIGILKKLNVHEEFHASLLTWMFNALMPSTQQVALQIIGPRDSGKSSLQRFLKAVIDPDGTDDLETPKTSKSLHKDAFQNHLLSYDDVEELKAVVEKDMEKILRGTHINVDHLYKKGQQLKTVNVRRPIIWNSLRNVVTNPKLQERVLTITLADNRLSDESFRVDSFDIAYCTAYIIHQISGLLNKFKKTNISDEALYTPPFQDFIRIGNTVFFYPNKEGPLSPVETELNKIFLAQATQAISSSVVGDALLAFINSHEKKDYTFKMIEWSEKLENCKADGVKWPSEPNKIGAELDKLSYLLKVLGIEIYQSNEQGERLEPGQIRSNYYRTLTFLEHCPQS